MSRKSENPQDAIRIKELLSGPAVFEAIFKNAVAGMAIADLSGNLIKVNEVYCHITGYPEEELLTLNLITITHEDDRERKARELERIRRQEIAQFIIEKRYVRKDGVAVWVQNSVSGLKDGSGQLVGFVVVVEDITVRQAATSSLAESEERLRLIIGSLYDYAIFTTDVDGIVTSWNPGAQRIFGFAESEIIGREADLLWTPEDREKSAPQVEMTAATERGWAEDERWHIRRDGTRFWASGTLNALHDAQGGLTGFTKICRDLTSQKALERQLSDTRMRREATLAAAEVGTYVWDIATDRLISDPNMARLFFGNEALAEAPGADYRDRLHKDDAANVIAQIEATVRGENKSFDVEYRVVRPDGSMRWVISRGSVLRDPDGNPLQVPGVAIDITERKRTERRLAELTTRLNDQANLYNTVLSSTDDFAYIFDLNGRFLYANRRLLEVWGMTLADVVGKTCLELGYPEWHADMHMRELRQVIETRQPIKGEVAYTAPTGIFGIYEYVFTPVFGPDRSVSLVAGTTHDVTERRRAEDDLRTIRERFALAVEAADIGTFFCPMPLEKIYWNDKCQHHFWMQDAPVVGFEAFYDRVHHDDRARTREAVEKAVNEGLPYNVEYRTVSPSGDVRWIHAIGQSFRGTDGETIRFDGATIDVTAQKALEAERESLLQAEQAARLEAERSGRMKDEFLATLSHELRTPLSSILGWAHVLRTGKSTGSDLDKGLETIERNARSQAQIIEDLLDMSRIISGKVRLEVELTDVRPILESAIDTVRHAAEAKGVVISTSFDSKQHNVSGDPSRLQQVFWNLLSNAVKFTPRDGEIQVALKEVGSYVEITVSDTGAGIDSTFLAHVFSRFRQADGSTTRRHGGLGLGLAIVKQLVELHGGTVQARSAGVGKGSEFIVTLPLATIHRTPGSDEEDEPTHRATLLASMPIVSLSGTKILIVEDEADARDLLARVLEEYGATVIKQPSALHAVELLLSERPDIIISDIGMPEEDGYSFIRRVRSLKDDAARSTPAIALTAYARSEDRVKAFLAGFQMHLAKPLETAELVTVVSNLHHQRLKGS